MNRSRRTFLVTASGIALAARPSARRRPSASDVSRHVQGANDRIRVGIIGTGGRARGSTTQLERLPGTAARRRLRRLRAAAAASVRDRGPLGGATHRLPPHPGRPADRRRADRRARPLAQDDDDRRRRRRQGRLRREADLAQHRGRRRDGESRRGVQTDRPGGHPAAKLGSFHRSASSSIDAGRLGQITFVHTYWSSTRACRHLRARHDGEARLEAVARPRAHQPFRPERFYQWRHYWDTAAAGSPI